MKRDQNIVRERKHSLKLFELIKFQFQIFEFQWIKSSFPSLWSNELILNFVLNWIKLSWKWTKKSKISDSETKNRTRSFKYFLRFRNYRKSTEDRIEWSNVAPFTKFWLRIWANRSLRKLPTTKRLHTAKIWISWFLSR